MTKTMLVVDDVPEIIAFFQRTLTSFRTHAIDMTATSRATDALMLASTRDFDVVVSDLRMPEVDGLRILAASRRRNPRGRRVLMTGYNEVPADAASIDAAAVDAILRKPISRGTLLEFLQACLSDDPGALRDYPKIEAE